ncbi:MAG: hypothetical protein IIY58_00200 [Aeriscardovia sp.]|nr:hypothetical protein [Aeriscardovia sp.]
MTRRNELQTYLSGLYVPAILKKEHSLALHIILENDYRSIEEADAGKMFQDCLIIRTAGNGEREVFKGFTIARVDIGDVGEKFADVAIYADIDRVTPMRVKRDNIKINLPNN